MRCTEQSINLPSLSKSADSGACILACLASFIVENVLYHVTISAMMSDTIAQEPDVYDTVKSVSLNSRKGETIIRL